MGHFECGSGLNHDVAEMSYRTANPSLVIDDLVPGRYYSFQVCADRRVMATPWSEAYIFSTPLARVSNIVAEMIDATVLSVTFDPVDEASSFEIRTHFSSAESTTVIHRGYSHSYKQTVASPPTCVEVTAISAEEVRSHSSVESDVSFAYSAAKSRRSSFSSPLPSLPDGPL